MHLVAIAELSGSIDAAIGPLATDLNTTAYELRLLLNAGLPAVVTATVDPAIARAAVATVARHKHVPVTCDRSDVIASSAMTTLLDFELSDAGIRADGESSALLPYDDIGVLLRASQQTTSTATEKVTERKLRPVMAVASGGLILSKKTTREVTTTTTERQQVLYIFRRSGATPWFLRERGAHYAGLGKDLRPASIENFMTTIRRLRERAPGAAYDERLLSGRPIRGVADGAAAVDILAHLLARFLLSRS